MKNISIERIKKAVTELVYPFVVGLSAIASFLTTAVVSMVFEVQPSLTTFIVLAVFSVIVVTVYVSTDEDFA